MGYGSGNIIFFGSVGVNKDDKSKTEAYQRLGKRAVASISDMSGESSILMPSFDYIEHITIDNIGHLWGATFGGIISDEKWSDWETGYYLSPQNRLICTLGVMDTY